MLKLEDNPQTIIVVEIETEDGCDVHDGEYSVRIVGIVGKIDVNCNGASETLNEVHMCITDTFDFNMLPNHGITQLTLTEHHENDGGPGSPQWHTYYEIERVSLIWDAAT